MYDAEEEKFSLKVVTNKERTKVLFAEADGHFVDVLLSFLTLPLGRIMKAMVKQYANELPIIGCLNTLYMSVDNLDSSHFSTEGARHILLNPTSSFDIYCRRLKLEIINPGRKWLYCSKFPSKKFWSESIYYDKCNCKCCGRRMKRDAAAKLSLADCSGCGVFTLNTETFVITDDLRIVPNAVGLVEILSTLDIKGIGDDELMTVTLGLSDVIDLLRASMISHTPLSDLLLKRTETSLTQIAQIMNFLKASMTISKPRQINNVQVESLSETSLPPFGKGKNPNSKKMILKVTVQKSTNRVLFAQAKEDFVEFLFSLLTIPLGVIECLLQNNTSIQSIDNLYKSVSDLIDDEYFVNSDIKNWLIKSKLPHGYVSDNQILPLAEESLPAYYYKNFSSFSSENFPQGKGKYIKGSRMYVVLDNLAVMPFSIVSIFCNLISGQRIPVSDMKEMEMEIGLEEALSILKASLASESALTNALLNPISTKQ